MMFCTALSGSDHGIMPRQLPLICFFQVYVKDSVGIRNLSLRKHHSLPQVALKLKGV
jgi:hypothetical protein